MKNEINFQVREYIYERVIFVPVDIKFSTLNPPKWFGERSDKYNGETLTFNKIVYAINQLKMLNPKLNKFTLYTSEHISKDNSIVIDKKEDFYDAFGVEVKKIQYLYDYVFDDFIDDYTLVQNLKPGRIRFKNLDSVYDINKRPKNLTINLSFLCARGLRSFYSDWYENVILIESC